MNEQQLHAALDSLPFPVHQVAVRYDERRLIGVVVSTQFEGMDEAERQRLVWRHLFDMFSDEQLAEVEFVFANTPAEDRELSFPEPAVPELA